MDQIAITSKQNFGKKQKHILEMKKWHEKA